MKKRILLFGGLLLCATGFAMAGGLEYQGGVGYHISILETPIKVAREETNAFNFQRSLDLEEILVYKNMTAGVLIYSGFGYGFGSSQAFSLSG